MTKNSAKMKPDQSIEKLKIPEGCTVKLDNDIFTIKGAKGELSKKIFHPQIKITIEGSEIIFTTKKPTQKEKKMVYTFKAHIKNLFKGASQGHIYRLKICSGHFPMTATFKNNIFEVKNFFGETVPRKIMIKNKVDIKINPPEITVEGISKEETSQTAAAIEQLTRRTGYDRRIFQDGIYITEKDGKEV